MRQHLVDFVQVPGLAPGPGQRMRLQAETGGLASNPLAELAVDEHDAASPVSAGCQRGGDGFICQGAAAVEDGHITAADHVPQKSADLDEAVDKLRAAVINGWVAE